jgi:uncharacterized membrane protein YhaH (DUF805 family)
MGALAHIFGFGGAATRMQALIAALAYGVCTVGLAVIADAAPLSARFLYPLAGLSVMAMLATMARRLHHAGYSGRWAALTLIPIAGVLAIVTITMLPQRKLHLYPHNIARGAGYGVMAMIALFAVMRIWWAPFWIPSESMKPTLLEVIISWPPTAVRRMCSAATWWCFATL